MITFLQYLKEVETIPQVPQGVDPGMWQDSNYRKYYYMMNKQQAPMQPNATTQVINPAKKREIDLFNRYENLIQQGFETGGKVPNGVVSGLDLINRNRSLVADGEMYAVGNAYPFIKEKSRGMPTGNIMYKRGYPINLFKDKIGVKVFQDEGNKLINFIKTLL